MSNTKFDLAMSILKLTKTDLYISRELKANCDMIDQLNPNPSVFQRFRDEVCSENTVQLIMTKLAEELASNPLNVLEEFEKFYKSTTYQLIQTVMAPLQRNMYQVVQNVAYDVSMRTMDDMNSSLYKLDTIGSKVLN